MDIHTKLTLVYSALHTYMSTHNQHQQQSRCSLDLIRTSKDLHVEDLVPGKYSEESLGEVIGS